MGRRRVGDQILEAALSILENDGSDKVYSEISANWVHTACGDVDRIEAYFSGAAFAPHRHDTYTIGITLQGDVRRQPISIFDHGEA